MTSEPAAFTLRRTELRALGQTIAPFDIFEESGGAIWVSANEEGTRTWIVQSDDVIIRITVEDSVSEGTPWAYPVPEQLLMSAQYFMNREESVAVRLDDDRVTFTNEVGSVSLPQGRDLNPPPITPLIIGGPIAKVHEGALSAVLEAASRRPSGTDAIDVNPPMHCSFDFSAGAVVLVVDWSAIGSGVCRFTIPATFSSTLDQPIEFVLPHAAVRNAVSHPMMTGEFDMVSIVAPGPDDEYMRVFTETWELFARVLPVLNTWGHDLAQVTGPYIYDWLDCGRVQIFHPRLRNGSFVLRAIGAEPNTSIDSYELLHHMAKFVIGGPGLTETIAVANDALEAAGSRARVELKDDELLLRLELSADDYAKLADHVDLLAEAIDALPSMHTIDSMSRSRFKWEPIPPVNEPAQAA